MADIIKIALTGADSMCISTVAEQLKKHYENKGILVYCLSDNESCPEIEISAASVLLLYVCSTQYSQQSVHSSTVVDLWEKYDACFFFESADADKTEQNQGLDCWIGHPHFRYIKYGGGHACLVQSAVCEIDCILNKIEHEIKYLIRYPDFKQLQKYKFCKTDIEQIYLLSDVGSHRIRRRSVAGCDSYFETLKIRIKGDSCYEYENQITAEEYQLLKAKADPRKHPIVKQRYCLLYDGQYFELDVFDFWQDRALIELELSYENQQVLLPPELEFIKDVSTDKHYKNNYLSTIDWNKNENSKTDIL